MAASTSSGSRGPATVRALARGTTGVLRRPWPCGRAARNIVVADVCADLGAGECGYHARRHRPRGLVAPILGHVGDGNYHVIFMLMPDVPAEHEAVERCTPRWSSRAHARGRRHLHWREYGIGNGQEGQACWPNTV